jgi:tetratricopeptide (TPR) repeat protein
VAKEEAKSWLEYAEGKSGEAVNRMRAAAEREDAAGVDSLTMPAREMLGDMLVEMNNPSEAIAEYKKALVEAPNRFDSLYGIARAEQLNGDVEVARKYYTKLVEISVMGADRAELQKARLELENK